jgi:hypothetical protein
LTKQTTSLSLSKPEITDKIVDTITQLANNFDILDSSLADSANDLVGRGINVNYPFGTSLTPVKGDGTDESTAIQAIHDYARDHNISTVILGKGTYLCNIILDSHMTLMGTGEKTILKIPNNSTKHCVTFRDNTTKFVTICNLTIDGNKSNQTASLSGLYLYSSDRGMYYDNSYYGLGDAYIRIDNVKVLNCKGDGIYLYIRGESIYTNIHSLNNDGNGIWGDVFDSFFTNISCGQNGKNGFRLYSSNNRFYNCKAWNNGINNTAKTDGRGIYLTGADNHVYAELQGNLLEGCFCLRHEKLHI